MKNTTKLKAIVLSLLMLIGLIPLTSFAQSDGFISNDDDVFGRDAWVFTVNTQNFGATPVGSGLLILGIAGAGYAVAKRRRSKRDIKKGTALLLAGLMLVGMTNCRKKVDTIASVGEKVHITVKVNGGGKAGVNPANGEITFNDGDYLYVGYDGAKVGELTYSTGSSSFGGDITISQSGDQPLYFYYMGGPAATVVNATHYTANISDQTGNYPVIATGPSTTNYEDGTKAYTVNLANKCGFVKFATNVNSTTVNVGGMNTKATLDFSDGTITPGTEGTVSFSTDAEGTGWAILLVQDAVDDATVTASGYSNGTCDVPAVTNNMLYSTGVGVTLTASAPTGAINGLFSVSSTKQVYFSQGNLQAVGTTSSSPSSGWTWQFAEHQYDYIGGRSQGGSEPQTGNNYINGNGTLSANGTVDLFCWSTNATYYGIHNGIYTSNYSGDFYDWGNAIGSGWRTLTPAEWGYLINTRTTTSGVRYAKAKVNNVNGLILLPDDWSTSYYALSSTNTVDAAFTDNEIDASTWASSLEAHGAVFLPAAGKSRRVDENNIIVAESEFVGYYWSTVPYDDEYDDKAYQLVFFPAVVEPSGHSTKNLGFSVRLVKDAN